ncbi:efflux RND transporter periplasmic adaptor subunit [Pseudomonas sp. 5P_3.1_Bac2]|uniref:efflux RND transporter periplasmic adaptor subunit n=1 Tax=Pseudomonas sp. 5P_3.1_Bac2 TaxID=2971617 RepID=UPI0021C8CE34|nr:efflux RND transporter periplasmic adaptor subunit [Pseudomonas sp. 5P_3.1_Bac2]MCU1717106.1 efflux RND transporter periplasmic adaptor subunit [Pseudomonas sp. 5P_3.1_Bac2]
MNRSLVRTWPLSVTFAALLALSGCGKSAESAQASAATKVTVAEVIQQPIIEWDEFTGRLEAPESVVIRPRVAGYIDKVAFREGDLVKKGDLLFQIDPRPFVAEVNRLEALLQQSKATQARAQSEASRGERLLNSNAMSTELAQARTTAAAEAKAATASVQAQLDTARLNLEFTHITAPINGRVSRALITEGNLVVAGDTSLTSVVSTDKVYAYFDADEQVFLKYSQLARQAGGQVRNPSPVYLGLTTEQGFPHLGKLDFIDNQVNTQTGTINGRAVFDNSEGLYTPGLYARIRLVGSQQYEAILVKDEAIGTDLGKKYVMVLSKDSTVQYRGVEIGPRLLGLRIIRSGLQQGDRIVINGLMRIRSGNTVDAEVQTMADASTLAELSKQRQLLERQATAQTNSDSTAPRG